MNRYNKVGLLTPDEELRLARAYRDTGSTQAFQYLVEANTGLVLKILREFKNYPASGEDLVQEGFIGLCLAIQKFDPERGI